MANHTPTIHAFPHHAWMESKSVPWQHDTAVVCSHTFKHVDFQIEVSIVLQSQNIIIGMSMMLEEVVFNSNIVVTSF
jgi:hypothetical protein